jgi:hypothetical protein
MRMSFERIEGMVDRLLHVQPLANSVLQAVQRPRRTHLPLRRPLRRLPLSQILIFILQPLLQHIRCVFLLVPPR